MSACFLFLFFWSMYSTRFFLKEVRAIAWGSQITLGCHYFFNIKRAVIVPLSQAFADSCLAAV